MDGGGDVLNGVCDGSGRPAGELRSANIDLFAIRRGRVMRWVAGLDGMDGDGLVEPNRGFGGITWRLFRLPTSSSDPSRRSC